MTRCDKCNKPVAEAWVICRECAALPPVRSEPMLAALDILRRLVEGLAEAYDEAECPNGQPACGMCKLVTEAKAFLRANARNQGQLPRKGTNE